MVNADLFSSEDMAASDNAILLSLGVIAKAGAAFRAVGMQ